MNNPNPFEEERQVQLERHKQNIARQQEVDRRLTEENQNEQNLKQKTYEESNEFVLEVLEQLKQAFYPKGKLIKANSYWGWELTQNMSAWQVPHSYMHYRKPYLVEEDIPLISIRIEHSRETDSTHFKCIRYRAGDRWTEGRRADEATIGEKNASASREALVEALMYLQRL